MQRKLLGIISVDFDATGQLLITYSLFIKYLRKNGNTMNHVSAIYRLQESLWFIYKGGLAKYSDWLWYTMKLARLIKMCLNETCSWAWVGKHLTDMFPIQDGLKLNWTHQLLVYADDNILGRSVRTIKNNADAIVVASKETGLEMWI